MRPTYDEAEAFSPIGRGVLQAFLWAFVPLLVLLIVAGLSR
jgi:hypothetical protein